jgi:hypothetical protein
MGQELVEIEFRFRVVPGQGVDETDPGKPWTRHANEA